MMYANQRKYDLAETLYKEALEASSTEVGPRHSLTLTIKNNLAVVYNMQEKYALAVTLIKEVLEVQTTMLPADHLQLLTSKHNLAGLYRRMRKFELAIPVLEETLKLRKAKLRPDHPLTLSTQAGLGVSYSEVGRTADAIPLLEEAYLKGRKYPELAWVSNSLLAAYERAGKKSEATALVATQVQDIRKQFPADSPRLAAALGDVGKALLDVKAYAAAEPLLRESLSLGERHAVGAWDTHNARSVLGSALSGQQKYAAAEPHLVQGYQGMKKLQTDPGQKSHGPSGRRHLTEALERLVQLYAAWDKPDEAAKWRKELEALTKAAEQHMKPKDK